MTYYELGQKATVARRFSTDDIAEFIDLTGDTNPIYTDPEACQRENLERPVVPAGLIGGMFSKLLGTDLPGRGANWMKQSMRFPAPAYVDDDLIASVEIVRLRPEKHLVNLKTMCVDSRGVTVCIGEALLLTLEME